jgi:hypothetical protein
VINAHKKLINPSFSKEFILIILAFFLLTLIKIFISVFFNSPWIFADETVYAETSRNIIHGEFFSKLLYCQTFPPGYSLFLSVVNMVFDPGPANYHGMLIINALLTSSIIFPAYFILKKYCPGKFSVTGSVFVALLPSVMLYNFVIMSENLFIPLFAFSLWFLIESFETKSKQWGILAGLSLFLLFFTRTMGIAMILGFILSLVFYTVKQNTSKKSETFLKDNFYSVAAFCIPTILWTLYKIVLGMAAVSAYDNDSYLSSIIIAVSNVQSFSQFLYLLFHEFEFLILSAYFIFFILAMYWMYGIFRDNGHVLPDQFGIAEPQKNLSIKCGIVYFLVSSIILLLLTVTHMFTAIEMQNNNNYYIFGRYLDPIVPVLFIFGLIGFNVLIHKKFSDNKKNILIFLLMNSLFIVLFLLDFPLNNYKFPNMFSIFYVQGVPGLIPFDIFIILFVVAISGVFILSLYYKKLSYLLLILLVIFSIFGMNYSIQAQYFYSSVKGGNSPVVDYLVKHSTESTRILMSAEDYNNDFGIMTWYSTQFFIKGYLVQNPNVSIKGDPKNLQTDFTISQKILPHNILAVSDKGFKLYGTEDRKRNSITVPYTINAGSAGEIFENFYPSNSNQPLWTKNHSRILVEYPKNFGDMVITVKLNGLRPMDNPAHVVFKWNDKEFQNSIITGRSEIFTMIVEEKYLEDEFQIFEIDTNTWRPSNYGSADSRDLGIQIEEIVIQNNTQKNFDFIPSNG